MGINYNSNKETLYKKPNSSQIPKRAKSPIQLETSELNETSEQVDQSQMNISSQSFNDKEPERTNPHPVKTLKIKKPKAKRPAPQRINI